MKTKNNVIEENTDMPRERLLRLGAQALADYELLAILLRTGIKGQSVLAFAQTILKARGGLVGLLTSQERHLRAIKGLGSAKIAEIMAVAELSKRFVSADIMRSDWQFGCAEDVRSFLLIHYKGLSLEELGIILLDSQNQFISFERFNKGSPDRVDLPVREIAEKVLYHHASALILVHNHPAGMAEPSSADRQVTQKIASWLAEIEVKVLDHFIVSNNKLISMQENGGW